MRAEEIRAADPVDVLIIHHTRLDAHAEKHAAADRRMDRYEARSTRIEVYTVTTLISTLSAVLGTLIWRLATNGGHL